MTSDRPYRKAMPKEAAFEELKRCAGSQFDPAVVNAFLSMQKRF
jgi:HD-GYP domain-containing protein (c-di-GMP phosphodiesterase class II)